MAESRGSTGRRGSFSPIPSVSAASLPPEKSLMATQHEVGTNPGVKGIPDPVEALPQDRGPQDLWGNSTESSGCVRTQKAAIKQISPLMLTAQPVAAHITSVTQTAQTLPQTTQISDTAQQGVNGLSKLSETDGKDRLHGASKTAQLGPGEPIPHLTASGPTPQRGAARPVTLGQGGAAELIPSEAPVNSVAAKQAAGQTGPAARGRRSNSPSRGVWSGSARTGRSGQGSPPAQVKRSGVARSEQSHPVGSTTNFKTTKRGCGFSYLSDPSKDKPGTRGACRRTGKRRRSQRRNR